MFNALMNITRQQQLVAALALEGRGRTQRIG
jgi:hypothetical protein